MTNNTRLTWLLTAIAVTILSACSPQVEQAPAHQPPAPKVTTAQVISERITEWDQFTGRLEAPQTVILRPRVSGYIQQVKFKEGSLVKQGQVLFTIDDQPFTVEVNRLKAEVANAKSQSLLSRLELERGQRLQKQHAISQEELDNRVARSQQSQANVQSRTAALATAQLNLDYTQVKAPINGRISRAFITKGNFVTAGVTELTLLVSTDKIYAYFDADERTYLKYQQLARGEKHSHAGKMNSPVMMGLAIDNDFPYSGHIDFIDNKINRQTGTIVGRAVFDNSNGELTPGLFARLKMIASPSHQGILIDDKAVGTDLNNKFVMVVDQDNKVAYRKVTLGQKHQQLRIITAGLAAGDIIVINGLQRIRPGATVDPTLVAMADDTLLAKIKQLQQHIDQINVGVQLTANQG